MSISASEKPLSKVCTADYRFAIPAFQRSYSWHNVQMKQLIEDVMDACAVHDGPYFLGSLILVRDEHGMHQVIDGQQRLTTLMLLLRAFYSRFKNMQDPNSKSTREVIGKCIWKTDEFGNADTNQLKIDSEVSTEEHKEEFLSILKTGNVNDSQKSKYAATYRFFQAKIDEFLEGYPSYFAYLPTRILNNCILLPIEAESQDTALRIFSTLNDRGMPLSDADIFKAKIYNQMPKEKKEKFIEFWKDLDERATYAGESIQQLFYYYMFYLRAKEGDSNSTTPGVRKYFLADKAARLYAPELMSDLQKVLDLWIVVSKRESLEGENWSSNQEILRALDILSSYPNEFWKYPVINYYLSHKQEERFEELFLLFLHKLSACLLTRYLMAPTINAVKADILKLNVEIVSTMRPKFTFREMDMTQLPAAIKSPNRNAVRMLLKMVAYMGSEQDGLLPPTWEIEHIFPQKWQTNYFTDIPDDVIRDKIEHIGNKLPFEKKLNIVAGNGYFGKKKESYAKSRIAVTKRMSVSPIREWSLDDITERDVKSADQLLQLIDQWNDSYEHAGEERPASSEPTPEELEMIRRFREQGWV